jgi:hypothetical protein
MSDTKEVTIGTKEDLNAKIRERIIAIVNDRNWIGGVELCTVVTAEICAGEHGTFDVLVINCMDDFSTIVEKCVSDGEIVELEFTVPSMEYRLKSIYFPKDTLLRRWRGPHG